jgi:uncharacterized membrane protein
LATLLIMLYVLASTSVHIGTGKDFSLSLSGGLFALVTAVLWLISLIITLVRLLGGGK